MPLISILKISLDSIKANKVRAFLTILGIIIGISAVIAMLSIGQGAQQVIIDQVQGLGANTITVIPVANFTGPQSRSALEQLLAAKLDHRVINILSNEVNFPEITGIAAEVSSGFEVSYRSQSAYYTVYGVNPGYDGVRELTLEDGRFISDSDESRLRKVAVIGPEVADKLFGENQAVDSAIKINGNSYTVIGVTTAKSAAVDDRVYVPLSTASNILIGEKDFSQLTVKVAEEDYVDPVAIRIEESLRDFFHVGNDADANFSVFTGKDVQELASTVTSIFTTLLASIAGISLVVGGIGIMNIMLVSVTERTREIGLRKAVGAKRGLILQQFLMEAVVLTLLGGIIGTVIGIGLGLVVGHFGGFGVIISWQSILLATSVSVAIGLVFGFYPAYRAARLNPIDALRYE